MPSYQPEVYDLLDSDFQDQIWNQSDKSDYDINGNLVEPVSEEGARQKPNAKFGNGVSHVLRQLADFFQGLAMPTALDVEEWFRLPRYATGSLPAGNALNEGRLYFDTTTNRIIYDDGGTLRSVANTVDVSGAGFSMTVSLDNPVDEVTDPTNLYFEDDDFTFTDNGDGTGTIGLNNSLALTVLANGSAQSVVGRSAGSSGEHADIAGTGTSEEPQILSSNGTLAFRTLSQLGAGVNTILEEDLSALATNAFTDGTEAVGELGNVTVVNTAAAGANWGLVNGTGLRMSGSSGTFSNSTQTGAHFYTTISALAALGYVPGRILYIDLVVTAGSFTNGNDRILFGLWGPAAAPASTSVSRIRTGFRGNNGGTQTFGTVADASVTAFSDATSPLAISVRIDPCSAAITTGHGTYSGGWPTFDYVVGNNGPQTAGVNQHASLSTRIVFAVNWINTCAWDISRWRFRQG